MTYPWCLPMTHRVPVHGTIRGVFDRSVRPASPAPLFGVSTMRTIRLTFLALLATFTVTACTSPTAYDGDCDPDTEECNFGHPGSGS